MRDLSAALSRPREKHRRVPRPGHEYVTGWGVFGLPFESGHVLALRVFPQNSFAPYRAVWHRDPDRRWSVYVHGPSLHTACPRYFGAACEYTGFARIGVSWTGPASLRITMDCPSLDWTLTASATRVLGALNTVSRALPAATWATAFDGASSRAARPPARHGPAEAVRRDAKRALRRHAAQHGSVNRVWTLSRIVWAAAADYS